MEVGDKTLLSAFTKIGSKLKGSKMQSSKLRGIKKHVELVCRQLNVTETECYLLVVTFIIQMQDEGMDVRDLARFLELDSIETIYYKPDFEELIKRKYLYLDGRRRADFSVFFSNRKNLMVHDKVVKAIIENENLENLNSVKLDVYQFNKKVSDLIDERENDVISTFMLFELVEELENENKHLEFISDFITMKLPIEERVLMYEMSDDYVNFGVTGLDVTMRDIYDSIRKRMHIIKDFVNQNNILFDLKLISVENGGLHNNAILVLTDKSRLLIFEGDADLLKRQDKDSNVKSCDDIESKELFFEEPTRTQLVRLASSLDEANFDALQQRMQKHNMKTGINAIFYGGPGTGKSESAYQLAKASGRDIMAVDLSNTKSMWFGESEKKIKEIFTTYRQLCNKSATTPILLFNEADGVLTKRIENQTQSVHQTENTIQNILLEEFENNRGIIIATTNLEKNLDSAFERRFLFKVKFEIPGIEVRKQIWLNKLPWISEEVLHQIVSQYNFSGGEIDNIVRKVITHEVTTGDEQNSEMLIEFCNAERFENKTERSKVGFLSA